MNYLGHRKNPAGLDLGRYRAWPAILALPFFAGCSGILATNGLDLPYHGKYLEEPAATSTCDGASMAGCKTGDTIVLQGVKFDSGKSSLTANAKVILNGIATALAAKPGINVEIDGHTDAVGGTAYNQKLSESRARSVMDYLVSAGIPANRLSAKGFGESMPIDDNGTPEGREMNRRVELKVVEGMAKSASPPSHHMTGSVTPMPAPPVATATAATTAGGAEITITDFKFAPAKLIVTPGTTVSWKNMDRATHTIKFQDLESEMLVSGGSYSRTFKTQGEYFYQCGFHPYMTGTVVVKG